MASERPVYRRMTVLLAINFPKFGQGALVQVRCLSDASPSECGVHVGRSFVMRLLKRTMDVFGGTRMAVPEIKPENVAVEPSE